MTLTLYTNKSYKNALTKDLEEIETLSSVLLKDSTSITDPAFTVSSVSASDIAACNYVYCPELGRYYFVKNIESLNNGLWRISCHVDVLSTYADEIKAQRAIVKRQEGKYNMYVNDGIFKIYQYSNIETIPFTGGFSTIQYVLCVAGN